MAPGQRPCTFFQMDQCQKGTHCGFAHIVDPNFKRKACQHFMRGKCNRGRNCMYSHDQDDIDFVKPANNATTSPSGAPVSSETRLRDFRWMIPKSATGVRPLGRALSALFPQALDLVNGEVATMQEVITLLTSEGGLHRIDELLGQDFDSLTSSQLDHILDSQLIPFFKVFTHPSVVASVLLRGKVLSVYNVMYVGDAVRIVSLFTIVATHLFSPGHAEHGSAIREHDGKMRLEAIEATLASFSKLVEVNTPAHTDPAVIRLANTFATLLEEIDGSRTFAMTRARKDLERVHRRINIGKALPDAQSGHKSAGPRATFQLREDMPGALSEEGRRHDNDRIDIRDITILPSLQEIQSSRNEYLPTANPRDWHVSGIRGLLDRHFRLLREDTVGQVRDAAKWELERLQNTAHQNNQNASKRQGARTYVYKDVDMTEVGFDEFIGVQIALRFAQPPATRELNQRAREEWWRSSKRLEPDALICLLSSEGSATFLVVASQSHKPTKMQTAYDLSSDADHAFVIAKPVKQSELHDLLPRGDRVTAYAQMSIVEFPGVLLPSFLPTLVAMQRASESLDMPFQYILAPTSDIEESTRQLAVKAPTYATKPEFRYDLSSITTENKTLSFTLDQGTEEIAAQLAQMSTLDPSQAFAVVSSLVQEMASIQGPPGTGKSHTGVQLVRVFLSNKHVTNIGPVLVCTQTNHALDAILERSLDDGVSDIVRIGSRSKSERLEDVNLRVLAQRLEPTKTEKSQRYELSKRVREETFEISNLLKDFSSLGNPASLKSHLLENYPWFCPVIYNGATEDGFIVVKYKRSTPVETWLNAGGSGPWRARSIATLYDLPPQSLTRAERRMLITAWISEMEDKLHERLRHALASYNDCKAQLDNLRSELQLRVLNQANIIGVTTSGLARNLELLRSVNLKVLICEEAGEILEAHLLTALLPSLEHCILIGDHQQLRPQVQNYDLSIQNHSGHKYALDVSLFERLVQPSDGHSQPLPFCTLNVQRRMHPSISRLVRETQYPHLQDHHSVFSYPPIVGMRRRLSWLHHESSEDDNSSSHSTTRTNSHEVNVVAALVRHLVQQGVYGSTDIAVITPYVGQLRKLRQKFRSSYGIILNERDVEDLVKEEVDPDETTAALAPATTSTMTQGSLNQALRLATVDNFQGEEAKVIIVSLVRSNEANTPGFLKTPNRINVLLSRAQHGMYIVGDTHTAETVPMWRNVIEIFRDEGNVSDSLELCCPRHPSTPMFVKTPADFARLSPEAGCDRPCEKQLSCGHACVAVCHSDMLHSAVFCLKPCTKLRKDCEHLCPKPCGEECGKYCEIPVAGIEMTLECGHLKKSLPCYQYQDPALVTCREIVSRSIPGCGHKLDVECHTDVNSQNFPCSAPCGTVLKCGHTCQRPCSICNTREQAEITCSDHGKCLQKCKRAYNTCQHSCEATCHGEEPCPLCNAKCETRCAHAQCSKKCSEFCSPCMEEQCSSGVHCPHNETCPMPCAAPCTWLPCSERCEQLLICGCRCPSVCGEQCPDAKFCQVHASDEVKAIQADLIMLVPYSDVDLDTDPCIFTPCGHIFTIDSLDGTMDMQQYYEVDPMTTKFVGLKTSAEPFSSHDSKPCPECRGSLSSLARYGRIVRRAWLDESAKKLTAWSNHTHHNLADQLVDRESKLMDSVDHDGKSGQDMELKGSQELQVQSIRKLKNAHRYRELLKLIHKVAHFKQKVSADEQPYQRVHDLVEKVRRESMGAGLVPAFHFSSEELQLREHLQAGNLLMRCYLTLFRDVINVHLKTPVSKRGDLEVDFAESRILCDDLINEAAESKNVRQQAESQVIWAKFAAMEYGVTINNHQLDHPEMQQRMEVLMLAGIERLRAAEVICNQQNEMSKAHHEEILREQPDLAGELEASPMQALADELADVGRMFREGLSSTEMRMVVTVMAKEFGGTGHWYRCVNGHPFTVGECGMPMQLARCPECGAGVGGQHHRAVDGVTQARDIDERFGRMAL